MNAFPPGFPFECSAHVFSYLELHDLCKFGCTSLVSLKETMPELLRRRNRLKQRFAYSRDWKIISGPLEMEKIGLYEDMKEKHPTLQWVPMPTVQERVDQLYKRIPSSHPLCSTVQELCHELSRDIEEENLTRCLPNFNSLFPRLQQVLRAHKLHAFILWKAIHSNPLVNDNAIHSNPCTENSTTLSRYMGDVFCITYLINQSNLRLVEGGPTNATFIRELRHQSDSSCYQSWVYMHSSILRVKPFTTEQRDRLGIPEFFGVSEMIPNDCHINEFFLSSAMTLVYNEFGPLGPAYRGRDVVRLRDISARRLFAFFVSSDILGETTRSALEWFCSVHEEARKVRPMTVRAPVVRLCSRPVPE